MRYLRIAKFSSLGSVLGSSVRPASEFGLPLEVVATQAREGYGGVSLEQVEIIDESDISETPKPLPERERYRVVLRDWAIAYLHRTNPGGVIQTTKPGPLDARDMAEILRGVATHPLYQNQTINLYSRDGVAVTLSNGLLTQTPGARPIDDGNRRTAGWRALS